jgi:thioredoxin 1
MSVVKNKVLEADSDKAVKNALGQKQPAILCFFDGNKNDKPFHDAIKQVAKKNDGLIVIKADVNVAPNQYSKYDSLALPAAITLTKGFFGRKVKSTAEGARPKDVRNHVDYLLNDTPLPEMKSADADAEAEITKYKVQQVWDDSFRKEVLKSKTPVLVDFWAPWCGPCKVIAPYVEEMSTKYKGQLKVVKVNTDAAPRTSRRYNIRSMPTFAIFEGGQEVSRFSGASPVGINNLIKQVL